MADRHETTDVDQLAVIRGMLSDLYSKMDSRMQAIDAKVDASRAEGAARGVEQAAVIKRMEGDLKEVRNEVKNLYGRVTNAENEIRGAKEDIRELRDQDADLTRQKSETDLEHMAAIGGAMAHVKTLDQNFDEMRAQLGHVHERLDAHGRVDMAICEVIGIDYEAVSAPPDPNATDAEIVVHAQKVRPKADLVKLARENKMGAISAALACVAGAIQLVLEILRH